MRGFRPVICASIVALHAAALYGVIYGFRHGRFPLSAWIWAFVMWRLSVIGVSVGYHRYFTHRSFQCDPWFEKVLCGLGLLAFEGTATQWTWDHSQHHRFADQEGDPHSPVARYRGIKGFFWGHVGWLFWQTERPKGFELSPLAGTPIEAWENNYGFAVTIASLLFPLLVAGWPGFWLAGCIRIVFVWHITWSINSFCHLFGETVDQFGRSRSGNQSRNNYWIIALDWIGEGWHRNHHEKPNCAYLGWRWHSLDLGKWTIQLLALVGLVRNVRKPS
jgi:stearoyl-CoA desaturase (delta-9 desaturase)